MCCAIVNRRWSHQRLVPSSSLPSSPTSRCIRVATRHVHDGRVMSQSAEDVTSQAEQPQAAETWVCAFFFPAFPCVWCLVSGDTCLFDPSVCACVGACCSREASRALWSRAFFPRRDSWPKVLYCRHICYCIFEFSRYTEFRQVSASQLFHWQVLLEFRVVNRFRFHLLQNFTPGNKRKIVIERRENWYRRLKSRLYVRLSSTSITAAF